MSESITFSILGRPWTVNAQRNMHHMTIAKHVRMWREAATVECLGLNSPQTPVDVHVVLFLRGKRSQDCGACYPAVKAVIDGMVDAGIIPDDTPEFLASITMHAPILGSDVNRMAIIVEEA